MTARPREGQTRGVRRIHVLLVLVALITTCSSGPVAYLVTDAATAAAMGGESALGVMLRSATAPRGLAARVLVAAKEEDVNPALDTAVKDSRTALVVCLTSVPLDLAPWASAYPNHLFAGYGGAEAASMPNWLRLLPARTEAYREAGRRLSRVSSTDPLGGRVGIILAGPTRVGQEEVQAFREGVAEAGGAEPLFREVRSLTDKPAAVRALRELRGQGVRYFLLKTYALTSACLEVLEQEGDRAVVEDCGIQGSCGSSVILSIETDWARTLAGVVGGMGEGTSDIVALCTWHFALALCTWHLALARSRQHVAPSTSQAG